MGCIQVYHKGIIEGTVKVMLPFEDVSVCGLATFRPNRRYNRGVRGGAADCAQDGHLAPFGLLCHVIGGETDACYPHWQLNIFHRKVGKYLSLFPRIIGIDLVQRMVTEPALEVGEQLTFIRETIAVENVEV